MKIEWKLFSSNSILTDELVYRQCYFGFYFYLYLLNKKKTFLTWFLLLKLLKKLILWSFVISVGFHLSHKKSLHIFKESRERLLWCDFRVYFPLVSPLASSATGSYSFKNADFLQGTFLVFPESRNRKEFWVKISPPDYYQGLLFGLRPGRGAKDKYCKIY